METDNSPILTSKPPPLNSDQLNYLIWRYLQESGYADAAVKLQRDWKVDVDSLPFSKHIKGQALVSLVKKGLKYHHLSLTIDENGRPSKQLNPSMYFFGPESDKPRRELPDESLQSAASPDSNAAPSRKHARESLTNGLPDASNPANKKGRKVAPNVDRNGTTARKPSASVALQANNSLDVEMTNGHPLSVQDQRSPSATEGGIEENGVLTNGTRPDERMDLDEDSLDAEQQAQELNDTPAPICHTLSTGLSIGIQVAPAKVANLTPSTMILSTDDTKHITRLSWRPTDRKVVTAMGDTFSGWWQVPDQSAGPVSESPFQDLVDSSESTMVSAAAWEPNGDTFAVATYSNSSGQLHLFDGQDLALTEGLPASQRAITSLQWHSKGQRLVGVAPYETEISNTVQSGSTILLWDLSGAPDLAGPQSLSVPEVIVDIDCANLGGKGIVCASGQNAVYHCRAYSTLAIEQKWTSNQNDQWTFVRCSWRGLDDAFLVAASADTASLWIPATNVTKREAHTAPITNLQLKPRVTTSDLAQQQEFATSSLDGTIKVWQYDEQSSTITSLSKLTIGHSSPLMTLSYSPDGFCLAGASYDQIRIWNAEHGYNLMASWQADEAIWNGSKLKDDDAISMGGMSSINGDGGQVTADHTLTWDVSSKKLAFGLGNQVAVIDFQR